MKRSELQVEFKTKEGKVQELSQLLKTKTHELEESSQEVEKYKKEALELSNTAEQGKVEARKLQAAVDHHKSEMELVMQRELAREEEVKVVVGQLEQRLSGLSTKLEEEVQEKVILEGLKLKMQEQLDSSSAAFEKIQEQLEAKTELVEAQKISIDNLYSQLTVSNQSFEALSKGKDSMEATHEEKIGEMAAEHSEKIAQLNEEHTKIIGEISDQHKKRFTDMEEEHKDKIAEIAEAYKEKVTSMEHEQKQQVALMADEHKEKEMIREHEKLKTDLIEEFEEKMTKENSEHEQMMRTTEEKLEQANSETRAEYEKLLAETKIEHERVIVNMESKHQNTKLVLEEQHLQVIQVLEARAEEWKIQVESLSGQLLERGVQSEELNKKLLENQEELNQMKVLWSMHEATLGKLKSQFKVKEECSQALIEAKEARICELQDRIEEAKMKHIGEIEDAERKETELKVTLDTYRKQVKEVEQSHRDSNQSYAANISALEQELMEFKLMIVNLETTKNEVNEKLCQMEKDLVEVKQNSDGSVKALEKKLGDAQSLVGELQGAISTLEAKGEKNAVTIADLENLLEERENFIGRLKEENDSAARHMNKNLEKIRKLEGKLSDAVTKTNLYKSKIETTSQECLATIKQMETSKSEASASIRGYQKR